MGEFAAVGSVILLFFLVFGMSATVDIADLRKQIRNRNALLTGISLQFIILPFLGFCVVKLLNMEAPMGIALLVVTSSPGGSYSNWWCSMFNADLALSVTMTAISTLLSVVMLPVNLIIYATTTYSSAVVKSLDWAALFHSLITVLGAIAAGLICSATVRSHKFNLMANKVGNLAGVALVTYSIVVSSSGQDVQIWNESWQFYVGVGLPCLLGLAIASFMATYFRLDKPERVAVAVECCYQNTGIATSVAITMFSGDDLATAVGVPLFYGICEAVILVFYCLAMWKAGWTKAPPDENICVVIATSYEVRDAVLQDPEAIEIVLGFSKDGEGPNDLIFAQTSEGYQIDEESLESLSNMEDGGADDSTIATHGNESLHETDRRDVEGEKEPITEEEVPHSTQVNEAAVRRRGRPYSSLEPESPLTAERTSVSSPPRPNSMAPAENDFKNLTGVNNGPLGVGVATALRSRVAGNRYTKAKVSGSDEAVEDDDDEQNFNFSSLSPRTSPRDVNTSIPADDKAID